VPLVLNPESVPESVLQELVQSLVNDLEESLDLVRHPRGAVLDPASLVTAEELLLSARALLQRGADRSPAQLAAEANLAYAAMLSAIDLVKSHTDVPRVPRARPPGAD
jgi:hypothetical protein